MEDKGKRIEELERENAYLKRLLRSNNIMRIYKNGDGPNIAVLV